MSDYQQRDNSGSLFKNEKKTKETHPDYKGSAMVDGVEFWLSAWMKTGKNGRFMSLALERKDANRTTSSKAPAREEEVSEDDMPF